MRDRIYRILVAAMWPDLVARTKRAALRRKCAKLILQDRGAM